MKPSVMEQIFFSHAAGYVVVTDNPEFLARALAVAPGLLKIFRVRAFAGIIRNLSYHFDDEWCHVHPEIIAVPNPMPEHFAGLMRRDPIRFYLSEDIDPVCIEVARGALTDHKDSDIWLYTDWHNVRKI